MGLFTSVLFVVSCSMNCVASAGYRSCRFPYIDALIGNWVHIIVLFVELPF